MSMKLNDPPGTVAEFISIATALASKKNLNELLHDIVSSARTLTCADIGMVYLLDQAKRHLHLELYQRQGLEGRSHKFSPVPLYQNQERNMRHYLAYGAFAGTSRYMANIDDYSTFDFQDLVRHDRETNYRSRSLAVLPLRNHEGITVGMLVLINMRDPQSDITVVPPDHLQGIIEAFACQAAVAISNVHLLEENRHLISVLDQANRRLISENTSLRTSLSGRYDFSAIIGVSAAMQKVFGLLEKIIDADATVLIHGETGTGKELIAQALHYHSARGKYPLVVQNCAALPENLLESELFGYKKGAFSGANADKKGLIEQAHHGTLFLDEIGDMPLALQAKLLRVLQERTIRPLGGLDDKQVDIRVVAATHCDLQRKITDGAFREDLYYRLSVFPIPLPPLRERRDDLPALLQHYVQHFIAHYRKSTAGLAPVVLELLMRYDYPGNIRELRNIVERCVILCEPGGHILPEHLPEHLLDLRSSISTSVVTGREPLLPGNLREAVEAYESTLIQSKLAACHGNQTRAAGELGIARRTLIEKINRYGINKDMRFATSEV